VNRSEEDLMKTNRYGQQRACVAQHDSILQMLITLFAERGRVGA